MLPVIEEQSKANIFVLSLLFLTLNPLSFVTTAVEVIEARIYLISLALNRINPLYYNSAQSLALTYQKILDGSEEWELLYYFSDFLGELDQANAVYRQISQELKLP